MLDHRTKAQLRNVTTDVGASANAAYVNVDRDSASRLSISAASIDDALYSAFGQRIVSTIFTETNQYRVILEANPQGLDSPALLGNLQLRSGAAHGPTHHQCSQRWVRVLAVALQAGPRPGRLRPRRPHRRAGRYSGSSWPRTPCRSRWPWWPGGCAWPWAWSISRTREAYSSAFPSRFGYTTLCPSAALNASARSPSP